MPIVAVDIDGVITNETEGHDYLIRTPNLANIDKVNLLGSVGCAILLYTSRLEIDREVTEEWLATHGVKYQDIFFDKVTYDYLIDDKASSGFENALVKIVSLLEG